MNTHTSNAWNDFNDAEAQQDNFALIPPGTIVPVRMIIRPGGYDDIAHGWTDGYATASLTTGAIYLACEFVVTSGPHAKRKMWSNLGLYSPKGPIWGQMGRSFIRALLNSARNILPQDTSPHAIAARQIASFNELDGIEFIARVDLEKDDKGQDRNVVKIAIEPNHKDYPSLISTLSQNTPSRPSATSVHSSASSNTKATPLGRPSWAQ